MADPNETLALWHQAISDENWPLAEELALEADFRPEALDGLLLSESDLSISDPATLQDRFSQLREQRDGAHELGDVHTVEVVQLTISALARQHRSIIE